MTDLERSEPMARVRMLDEALVSSRMDAFPVLLAEELPVEAIRAFQNMFPNLSILPTQEQTLGGVLEAAKGVRAVVTTVKYRLDRQFFQALPDSVQIIALYSAGHDHVDIEAARERGVAVVKPCNVLADSVADLTIALLLATTRRLLEGVDLVRSGGWSGWSPTLLLGRELRGQVLGIYGMGNIGREVSTRAQAFGMNIAYKNRTPLPRDIEGGARFVADDKEFLAGCDVLLLSAACTAMTRNYLNAERISWLKPGAVVLNVSRGELVDDDALIAALLAGEVAGAGLDVFQNEPALDARYLTIPSVVALPHIGSATLEARTAMADSLVDGIERILLGQTVAQQLA
ncbi:D-glycerate dehydrogenase [Nitratireductor sp. CAU 1489]|uniref:D-glycerate dehydrogenase n=1 Tax=Nitratireductor arenosus TaxID=2682096 RepID=A0A844QDN3_9HYPH|nr:NAD(P)-dependent oxidoreductase [Nitratireductor arenosus]MVA96213.1 D-glycerate dehydrogenase [Nitratireductor arenosus]